MEQIEWGYIRGYTDGLIKAREIINYICDDMKMHKRRITPKELDKVFDIAITGRAELRENPDAFVRCIENGYEVFKGDLK